MTETLNPPSAACVRHGQDDDTPLAPCEVTWSVRSGIWAVTVPVCPHCAQRHVHGGNEGPRPDLGLRAPHCLTGPHPDYRLVETAASLAARKARAA